MRVGRGYRDAIRKLFGRTAGCTHMNELAGVMGSAAMQALWEDMPQDPERKPFGRPVVALDSVGAGVGEFVFFVRGREASFPIYPGEPPADACVVGIVDRWDLAASGVA